MRINWGVLCLLILFMASVAIANQDLLTVHGRVTSGGALLTSGNVRTTIYDSATGGSALYDSLTDFDNSINSQGIFDNQLGSGTVRLDLNYAHRYYLDLSINTVDIDFGSGSDERLVFESSKGQDANLQSINIGANGLNVTNPTGATKFLTVTSTGNVGIGNFVSTPSVLLDLNTNATGNTVLIKTLADGATNAATWSLGIRNSANNDSVVLGQTSSAYTTGGSLASWLGNSKAFIYYPTSMEFGTGTTGGAALELSANNRVGIGGDTTPDANLEVLTSFMVSSAAAGDGDLITGDSSGLTVTNGTVLVPSYSFVNSATTGMSSSTSNQIDFSTNAVRRMTISSTGDVNVYTGDLSANSIGSLDNNTLTLRTNRSARVIITPDGNVGINVTPVGQKFAVVGTGGTSAWFSNTGLSDINLVLTRATSSAKAQIIFADGSTFPTPFIQQRWALRSTSSSSLDSISFVDLNTNLSAFLIRNNHDGGGISMGYQEDTSPDANLEVIGQGFMHSSTAAGNGDLFRVHPDGNVGIGDNTPAEKLEVNGNIRVDGNIVFDTNNSRTIGSPSIRPQNIYSNNVTTTVLTTGDIVLANGVTLIEKNGNDVCGYKNGVEEWCLANPSANDYNSGSGGELLLIAKSGISCNTVCSNHGLTCDTSTLLVGAVGASLCSAGAADMICGCV